MASGRDPPINGGVGFWGSTGLRCACGSVGATGPDADPKNIPGTECRGVAAHGNVPRQRRGLPIRSRHARRSSAIPRDIPLLVRSVSAPEHHRDEIASSGARKASVRHPSGIYGRTRPWTAIARRAPTRGCFARARPFRSSSGSIRTTACRPTDNARCGNTVHIHPGPTARSGRTVLARAMSRT